MWHAIETALDVLDLVVHWRFYVCFLSGLALAFLAYRVLPDPNLATIVAIAVGVAGFITGLVWAWRS